MPVTTTQRQILFVDDDSFLERIGQLLESECEGRWKIHLANSTSHAQTLLREQAIDVAVRLQELLVASPGGEVLFEWQCQSTESRLKLLELIARTARELGHTLPLGDFERAEFKMANQRVAAQITQGRQILLISAPADTHSDA